jgi:hypothetical protein
MDVLAGTMSYKEVGSVRLAAFKVMVTIKGVRVEKGQSRYGRTKLATSPDARASVLAAMRMGMIVVALSAASIPGLP